MFCETRNVLLCHYCVEADRWKLITFSTKGDDAFVKSSFSRWKNALSALASMRLPAHISKQYQKSGVQRV